MVETELKECGEAKIKMRKKRGYYSCRAYFLVVLLMLSFSFVLIVTALVPCVFFSVADHNGGAKPRETLGYRVGGRESDAFWAGN